MKRNWIIGLITVAAVLIFALVQTNLMVKPYSKNIYLYGEEHSIPSIFNQEFDYWYSYYHKDGMRHLFLETSYFQAEFLNEWMRTDNDEILEMLFGSKKSMDEKNLMEVEFFKRIKEECPETVFHGTDIGHDYHTTGRRYLKYLESLGQKNSVFYKQAQENMKQGEYFYKEKDHAYRENKMTENFIREIEKLNDEDIMGIYGGAHTQIGHMRYAENPVPNMASQLYEKYGDAVHSKYLGSYPFFNKVLHQDKMEVEGQEYSASYFGQIKASNNTPQYKYWDIYRLEDAYEDFKNKPKTGTFKPYQDYPMAVETGQIFVVDYTKQDGTSERHLYRCSGDVWQGELVSVELSLE